MRVALVLGMHHHGHVAQHGFRARGRHHELAAAVAQRIGDGPQEAVFLLAHHFQIGDGGLQHRVPVHQLLAAVDQALRVQAHEGFHHGPGQALVHGEARARPVARGAEAAHLPLDGVARLLLPLPHALDEGVAAEVIARGAFAREQARDDHLRGDAGVVGAELPQRVAAAHAVVADQRVHDRVLERVAHVQRAGHVRRRQHDAVGLARSRGLEVPGGLPLRVPLGLDGGGLETLFHGAETLVPARCAGGGRKGGLRDCSGAPGSTQPGAGRSRRGRGCPGRGRPRAGQRRGAPAPRRGRAGRGGAPVRGGGRRTYRFW